MRITALTLFLNEFPQSLWQPQIFWSLALDNSSLISMQELTIDILDASRRRWLRAQVTGMHTSARKMAGENITYVE